METGYLIVLLIAALACPISMWLMMRGHGPPGADFSRRTRSSLRARASSEPGAGGAGSQRTYHGAQKPREQSAGGEIGALQEDGRGDEHEEEPSRDEDASGSHVPAPARARGEEQERDGRVKRSHREEERPEARSEPRRAPLHNRRQGQE